MISIDFRELFENFQAILDFRESCNTEILTCPWVEEKDTFTGAQSQLNVTSITCYSIMLFTAGHVLQLAQACLLCWTHDEMHLQIMFANCKRAIISFKWAWLAATNTASDTNSCRSPSRVQHPARSMKQERRAGLIGLSTQLLTSQQQTVALASKASSHQIFTLNDFSTHK